VAPTGWVLFLLLLVFFLPLCWLPFVLDICKDEERKCAACGKKLVPGKPPDRDEDPEPPMLKEAGPEQ